MILLLLRKHVTGLLGRAPPRRKKRRPRLRRGRLERSICQVVRRTLNCVKFFSRKT